MPRELLRPNAKTTARRRTAPSPINAQPHQGMLLAEPELVDVVVVVGLIVTLLVCVVWLTVVVGGADTVTV